MGLTSWRPEHSAGCKMQGTESAEQRIGHAAKRKGDESDDPPGPV